jgi:hypothetical protein
MLSDAWALVSSQPFIVGSIIGGLFVNLLSTYAQRRLDRVVGRWDAWRRSRTEAQQVAFDAQLLELVSRPSLVELYIAREARLWGACVAFMLLAVTMGGFYLATSNASPYLTVPRLIIAAGSLLCLVGSMVLMDSAMRAGDVLRALYKKRLGEP